MNFSYVNQTLKSNNHSGYTGIHWDKKSKKWVATIRYAGSRKHLGSFKDIDDAVVTRVAVAEACDIMRGLKVPSISIIKINGIQIVQGIIPNSRLLLSIAGVTL